ncbi:hypothetical protein JMA_04070 [Jeotgalibacillus malaysiensis]|uniref:DUF3953 domain-containing protein n=2 Tax=Jeotgalibacillus malaysiensis TaxID=1508404 RepID=A0A0B5ANW1_9BACL|nr:DUF3953 domain-containing protein [Jeotgalibacillus malaysiensis]AJD89724.1 hypothetical protein JMA_04070 [Jeotgalibacillus malaysiensis]
MTLKLIRITAAAVTFAFAMHGLITGSNLLIGWMMLSLGVMMLVMGIEEIQKDKKLIGYVSLGAFVLISSTGIEQLIQLYKQ